MTIGLRQRTHRASRRASTIRPESIRIVAERLMVHRVEELDDLTLDLHRVGNGDLAVLQVPDRLGDDRLAVSGRAVHEHRVSGGDRRPELVEHLLTDHEMRERVADACARNRARDGATVRLEVCAILPQRYRRDADVLVVLQKQQRPPAALVRDPVPVRGPADHRAAEDLALVRSLQEIEHGLDDRELQTRRGRASSRPV